MDSTRALLVDAFTDDALAGNAAGVVPDADGLSDAQMQAVARELGASETAFFRASERADRRVRYFTPTTEVDLCGHATIAGHAFLREAGDIADGAHTLETNVGVLDIELDGETVWMTQDSPAIRTVDVDAKLVAGALDIDTAAIADVGLPLARSSTGLPFLVVPVAFLSVLGNCEPDLPAVEDCCEAVDAVGIYAFTFDTLSADATAHGRMFAPLAGVPEDPVTGTASGAVGAYLREFEAVDAGEMVFEQGHFLDRPGRVRVRIGDEVWVGGRAAVALDGTLTVPDSKLPRPTPSRLRRSVLEDGAFTAPRRHRTAANEVSAGRPHAGRGSVVRRQRRPANRSVRGVGTVVASEAVSRRFNSAWSRTFLPRREKGRGVRWSATRCLVGRPTAARTDEDLCDACTACRDVLRAVNGFETVAGRRTRHG